MLSIVLRHFQVVKRENIMTLLGELVLRPKDGVNVRLASRTKICKNMLIRLVYIFKYILIRMKEIADFYF